MTTPKSPAAQLLRVWLARQLPAVANAWLDGQLGRLASPRERDLHVAFGLAPRRLGKSDLDLDDADLAHADTVRPGWDPRDWSVDQAARILLLLHAGGTDEGFAVRFTQICRTADVTEAIALYRGLPLYPAPGLLEATAAEAVRSNMRVVFEALAHHNPYPREQFTENRWNHMVLKALFVGSPLHPIQGLDARTNPALMLMLTDYARERRAAGRPVSPELWRPVGPHADTAALADLERIVNSGDEDERRAAALALSACPDPRAGPILQASAPHLQAAIGRGDLTWDTLHAAS